MRGPTGPLLVVFSRQSDNQCTARLHLSSAFDYVNERQFEACNRTCGLVEPTTGIPWSIRMIGKADRLIG